jgi:hypothetical protein
LPLHCLLQQAELKQTPEPSGELHAQSAGQLPQFSPGWQTPLPHTRASEHLESVPQTDPTGQPGGHLPPQASSPHSFPAHAGAQQAPAAVHFWLPVHAQSPGQLLQSSPMSQMLFPQ